ncbi:phosphatidylinositol-binding protein scs2, partial [Microbotryomycetes sp. JL201]
ATSSPSSISDKANNLASAAGGAAAGAAAAVGLSGVASTISEKSGAKDDASNAGADDPLALLKSQLAQARAEIETLKSQLQNAENTNATLRSRGLGAKSGADDNNASSSAGQAVATQHKGSESGVSVQTLLVVSAGVFVVTWLLF